MSELQNGIIKILSSHSKYNIIEYMDDKNTSWGLFRENNINEFILFFDNLITQDVFIRVHNYIKNNYGDKDTTVYIVIISDNDILNKIDNTLEHPYVINNVKFEIILLDEVAKKVIYWDEEAYDTAHLINNIISITNNNNKVKKEKNIITNTLIIINIAMFLVSVILSKVLLDIDWLMLVQESIFDLDGRVLLLLGAKYNPLIDSGQYYRFVTSMFLHGGLVHIMFNMYALRSLGTFIESIYGRVQFITIYFLGGVCASFFSYTFSDSMSVGASGAIFSLLGAALFYGIKKKNQIGRDFLSSIIQVITINLIMGFTLSNIDNYAHIGGLVGGIITSLLISIFYEKKKQRE